jgi:1,4-dihydroxy-2-naphthoate octaprenyltransferase
MLSQSTWLHLRIPFSYFLLPVYLFALGFSIDIRIEPLITSFLIIHVFLYPASNGFNSYFDRDEKSIGGLKKPPPVKIELYKTALVMDGVAIVSGLIVINITFGIMLLLYGLVSKMYSHPSIRLKKYAIAGWLITGLFQGFFTFMMCYIGINKGDLAACFVPAIFWAGILTSIMLWGNYPMTQIYQHEEDSKHGDHTLSLLLGIRGTFYFVQAVFLIATIGFVHYFRTFFKIEYGYIFLLTLSPVIVFFMIWFFRVWKDEAKADYQSTMNLNLISSTCLNGFFIYFFWMTHS